MLKLSKDKIDNAEKYIKANCRSLEYARFNLFFKNGPTEPVIEELKKFQNADGGFGHALEPDFMLPDSSPLSTSIAFQFLDEIKNPDKDMVHKAVQYLEKVFVKERSRWFAISEAVNDYPHAVWWHWDKEKKQTVIDESWANPSAELIGFLNTYREHVTTLNVDELTEYAISWWEKKEEFTSEHDVYCYIRLYRHLPQDLAIRLEKNLIEATKKLVAYDPEKWKSYTPQPLHFANSPNFFLYDVVKDGVETNLDYLINTVNENGVWGPNWTWRQYENVWPQQKVKWEGVITIQNLKVLAAYDRIEK